MGTFGRGFSTAIALATVCAALAQGTSPVAPAGIQQTPTDAGLAPIPADAAAAAQQPAIIPADPGADLPAIDPTQPAPVPKKAAPKKKVAPKAPAIPTAKGAIVDLNKTAMTVTIDAKGGEQTYKITSKTRIFVAGKPAITGDLAAGDSATVEYRKAKDGGAAEAISLSIAAKK